LTNPKASFWIDNRGEFFYGLVDLLIAIPTEVQKVQKSIEEDMQKEAELEATVRTEIATSETVAIISVEKLTKITVTFDEKRDDFRKIIKGHGFSWGDGHWYRNINAINGSVADRVAEVGNALLVENFIIRIFDEELRTKAVEGIYEPEHTRWIQKRTSGKYKGCFALVWKRYHEDFYEVAQKIPTSKWSNPSVVVRPEQFEAVLDFANEYDFRLSQGALELVEESGRAKEAQLVPMVKKGADAKSANVKQRDFNIHSVDIDDELVD
jgi:virulence-associated protein VapD